MSSSSAGQPGPSEDPGPSSSNTNLPQRATVEDDSDNENDPILAYSRDQSVLQSDPLEGDAEQRYLLLELAPSSHLLIQDPIGSHSNVARSLRLYSRTYFLRDLPAIVGNLPGRRDL
jgi:hypothetical protein